MSSLTENRPMRSTSRGEATASLDGEVLVVTFTTILVELTVCRNLRGPRSVEKWTLEILFEAKANQAPTGEETRSSRDKC